MIRLLLGILLFASVLPAQVTVRLRGPQAGPTLTICDWSAATPATITLCTAHGLVENDKIYIQGVQNNVNVNGYRRVKQIISPTEVSLKDEDTGADIVGYSGFKVDNDPLLDGNQLGTAGKWLPHTINAPPNGVFGPTGTARTRLFGPAGEGSGTSLIPTDDQQRQLLIARANAYSSPACDGADAILCFVEDSALMNANDSAYQGDWSLILMQAWEVTGVVRYLNSSRYLANNVHKIGPRATAWTGADERSPGGGWGASTSLSQDYWTFYGANHAAAANGIWGHLNPTEQSAFLGKIFNGSQGEACTNMLPLPTGSLNAENGSNKVYGSGFTGTAGRVIFIAFRLGRYSQGGVLSSITVSGSTTKTAVLSFSRPIYASKDAGFFQISDSGVTDLDGWYPVTVGSVNVTSVTLIGIPATVPNGTYTTPGMSVFNFYNSNPSGHWARVASVQSDMEMTITPAMPSFDDKIGGSAIGAPYAFSNAYQSSACGVMWAMNLHPYNVGYSDGYRPIYINAAFSKTDTQISVNPQWINNLRGIPTPFFLERGDSRPEIIKVNSVDFENSRLNVERGQFFTPPAASTTASEALYYRKFRRAYSGSDYLKPANAFLGVPDNNLNNTRAVNQLKTAFALVHTGHPAAIAWAEKSWNYYYDVVIPVFKASWTGISGGGATTGYHFGRFVDWMAEVILIGRHTLSPAIDLMGEYIKRPAWWMPAFTTPWASFTYPSATYNPQKQPFSSDSGALRDFKSEFDEGKLAWMLNYLAPGSVEQRVMTFWMNQARIQEGNGSIVDTAKLIEHLPFMVAYGVGEQTDYRTLANRAHLFWEVDDGARGTGYNVLVSRSGWNPTDSVIVANCINRGTDHLGIYNLPCALLLSQGSSIGVGADLVAPGMKGAIAGNNAQYQAGVRIDAVPAITIGALSQAEADSLSQVCLDGVAGANGADVQLSSDAPQYITSPRRVVIPAGSTCANVPLMAYNSSANRSATLTATSSNSVQAYSSMLYKSEASFIPGAPIAVDTLAVDNASFVSGAWATATATLVTAAPNGGVTISLESNNANVVAPASVRVRSGQTAVKFYVSSVPTISSQLATITASTGSGSPKTVDVTATGRASLPAPAALGAWMTSVADNAGGLTAKANITIQRAKLADDFAYVRADGSKAYNPNRGLEYYYRDIVHWIPPGQQSYVIVRDVAKGVPGSNKVQLWPFYPGSTKNNIDLDVVNASPVDILTRTGGLVTFVKTAQNVSMQAKILLPTAGIYDNFASLTTANYSGNVYVPQGQTTGDAVEWLTVLKSCPSTACALPTTTEFSGTEHRGVFINDPTCPVVAVFPKDGSASVSGISFDTPAYSGMGCVTVIGQQPGTYDVARNGSNVVTSQVVGTDGTLRFNAASGTFNVILTGTAVPLAVTTPSPLPNAVSGQPYSTDLGCSGGVPPYSVSLPINNLPSGLTFATDVISGTTSVSGSTTSRQRCQDSAGSMITKDLYLTVESVVDPLSIVTASLPSATVGIPYSSQIVTQGGVPPISCAVTIGELPAGISLTPGCLVSGVALGGESSPFTVTATDSRTPNPQTYPQQLTIPLTLEPLTLSPVSGRITTAQLGTAYSYSFVREGGVAPFTWSISGAPAGISIVDGQIVGTPTAIGDFVVTVTVTDDTGESVPATVTLPVRTSSKQLGLVITAAGQSGLAKLRAAGVDSSVSCPLLIFDSDDQIVSSATFKAGSANRTAALTGLSGGRRFTGELACDGKGGSFTFFSEEVTGTRSLPLRIPAYPGINNVLVEYGTTPDLGTAVSAPCGSDCNLTLPALTRGQIYYIRRRYRDAANTVIKESSVSMTLIQ